MPCVSKTSQLLARSVHKASRLTLILRTPVLLQQSKSQTRTPVMVQCSSDCTHDARQSLSVAVIGAGAAGLVAARELSCEGHKVTVFEKGSCTGGVWVYTDDVESPDLLGQDPKRRKVHSSMYSKLRTNLPREVMAYTDFAFDDLAGHSQDTRSFPSHAEVLRYLQAFAAAFQLHQYVTFDTEVTRAIPLFGSKQSTQQQRQDASDNATAVSHQTNGNSVTQSQDSLPWPKWEITTQPVQRQRQGNGTAQSTTEQDSTLSNGSNMAEANTDLNNGHSQHKQPGSDTQTDALSQTAIYDALVVCNGHYSAPRCPEVSGSEAFPGTVMHSHNYRTNEAYRGQTVVLVGASASGDDICREIAEVADKVYLCARSWQNPAWAKESTPFGHQHNIWRRPVPSQLGRDGSVTFSDGQHVPHVDTVMYCTGYLYTFPFLDNIVSTADNRVSPVYRHIFPLSTAPTLSIIGLPWKVVPFPEFEVQAKWIARVLSKRVGLPSMQSMQNEVEEFYADLEHQNVPARYRHQLGDKQWAYKDWIAEQCGSDVPKTEPWRRQMYEATGQNKREFPDRYRDIWQDDDLVNIAKADASKHSKELRAG